MAHKKAGGSSRNGRDSVAKRRGVKLYEGETARAGNIIIRQKGTNYFPGEHVAMGKDFTLFAMEDGVVYYKQKKQKKFNGRVYKDTFACVKVVA
ncbi:MAG: 50S ribosomal protein L27, large subunit ribosomal protein L27 [Candidatus Peregrinibacteria bacterium GW2011_GWF2_33_10]|nr:MAG: 50S ribosomal protein L27, large subunit ribosomal protein L27 [Candidatus Peregrinibacteria bacterium GW2011_GWF2_33_10]OGJ44455.1 MAG: 50S ribosomal protein L27 [Candidatus Peregrinibacteria bacterium RIFOXYA12_FULL_33_12]OGJ45024.1 MAG: 50S ribosomal protein L27 [Candidatus Peregrinibacteria bacterium RIFOXYA2_FULL_33_21]OGJ51716.1 MAG: 50S ribosomal protein L27 [Candidatus Peregrinibacteria bacterium RIFOXYB2_FULL_33_20]